MKRVGIIGASGYAGHELVKLLTRHPDVDLPVLNSKSFPGWQVKQIYPDYIGIEEYTGYSVTEINKMHLDLIFLALPHGLSMAMVPEFDDGTKIIDLSPDYRFSDKAIYEAVYGQKPLYKNNEAAYGLPELFAKQIKRSRIVANPGCYATAAILATWPIQKYASHIIYDCKSGWSGAGRDSKYANDSSLTQDNLIPYALTCHRHKYEIQQFVKTKLSFTPHILDTFRGMMCTAHVLLKTAITDTEVAKLYADTYKASNFVKVVTEVPQISATRLSNFCEIGGFEIDETNQLVIVSTIDNLLKGASGQAVQNMNLMLGFKETAGLL